MKLWHSKAFSLAGLLLALAAGCSSPPSGAGGGLAPDAAVPTIDGSTLITDYTVTIGPLQVAPLEEKTFCIEKKLGNPNGAHFGTIHNILGLTSHHMVVYRTNDTEEMLTPFACQPFVDTLDPSKGAPMVISQKADDLVQLPPGVAYTLDPDQMIRLELHYINANDQATTVTASTTFTTIPDADFQNEADIMFVGDADINVPAHSAATLGPIYFQVFDRFDGVNFYAITGHEHQWGTDVTVATALSKADDSGDQMIYDIPNWKWSDPATVYPNPVFQVPTGGGFRFTCTWENLSDNDVRFGESANDEMCFFWAYYYPSQGSLVCVHTDQVNAANGGYDLCCPGDPLCGTILSDFGGQ